MSLLPSLTFMQGTGNCFAIVDQVDLVSREPVGLMADLLGQGIPVDGLLVLSAGDSEVDIRMGIINADGSSASMCGNGLRCVAFELHRRGIAAGRTINVAVDQQHLKARVLESSCDKGVVWARMPSARVESRDDHEFVDLGNLHGIIQYEELPGELEWKQEVECRLQNNGDSLNWHAVEVCHPGLIRMKSWERGVGPTLACASGATATVAALATKGISSRCVDVHQPGGQIRVNWRGAGRQLTNVGSVGLVSMKSEQAGRDDLAEVM
ncbi:MAG: diaminopimelate epimerase [Phycisphaerae bacterium]|nr:diaminopimelate epimerase [Phycisphaerae bacterium]